jgi:hypothetical protein
MTAYKPPKLLRIRCLAFKCSDCILITAVALLVPDELTDSTELTVTTLLRTVVRSIGPKLS